MDLSPIPIKEHGHTASAILDAVLAMDDRGKDFFIRVAQRCGVASPDEVPHLDPFIANFIHLLHEQSPSLAVQFTATLRDLDAPLGIPALLGRYAALTFNTSRVNKDDFSGTSDLLIRLLLILEYLSPAGTPSHHELLKLAQRGDLREPLWEPVEETVWNQVFMESCKPKPIGA